MKKLAIAVNIFWYLGWFIATIYHLGYEPLPRIMTIIFLSSALGYILCYEIEKKGKGETN